MNEINNSNNIVITNQINIPKFTTAHELLEDKFSIEIPINNNSKKNNNRIIIELTLGDKVCFVKPSSNLVCDTIIKGHLSKRHGGLESPTVFVLVGDNKLDFYNIVEIVNRKYKMNLDTVLNNTIVIRVFTIYQLADFLINNLEKHIKKYKSKLFIITGDFYIRDPQISKQDKERLYSQMIKAVNNITDSIMIIFSPIKLTNLHTVLAI